VEYIVIYHIKGEMESGGPVVIDIYISLNVTIKMCPSDIGINIICILRFLARVFIVYIIVIFY